MSTNDAPALQIGDDVADGIYENLGEAFYRAIPRMNPSTLEWGMESMEHLKAAIDGQLRLKTKALAFGIAGHCRLLEPEVFRTRFAIAEQCAATTGKGARCTKLGVVRQEGQWLCSTHTERETSEVERVTDDEFGAIEKMVRKVKAHPAVAFLRQVGGFEVTLCWTDPTGLKMKTRLDKWIPDCLLPGDPRATPTILDIKYLARCDDRSISQSIEEYGYARRAAISIDGIQALTGLVPDYILVCILNTPPYSIAVRQIGEESIKGGRWEYRNLIGQWQHCLKANRYPGYGDDIQQIDVPAWKLKEYLAGVPHD